MPQSSWQGILRVLDAKRFGLAQEEHGLSQLAGSRSAFDRVHSLLFAPGDDDRKLSRALESQAHAVIADLEDAVAPNAKSRARDVVRELFGRNTSNVLRIVRVNAVGTPYFEEDLDLVLGLNIDGVMLPKATVQSVARLSKAGPVLALLESATGIRSAGEIAECDNVHALALGSIDLGAEVGIQRRDDGQELLYARSKLVIDSTAAGLRQPFDTVYTAFKDMIGLEAEARLARSLGMGGKLCIHPDQVGVVNRVYAPQPEEVEAARDLIASYEASMDSGQGVMTLRDEMVDRALLRRARRVLDAADIRPRRSSGGPE